MKNGTWMAAVVGLASAANADTVLGTITADNHYAIYGVGQQGLFYVGGNEIDAGGAPGLYNWSEAENWAFETQSVFYIAAWSDDSVAQGLLADFSIANEGLLSGDPRWEVFGTDINRGDGDAHPFAWEIASFVDFADANALWESPYVGNANGDDPWGTIAGISNDARWMWRDTAGDVDPLHGGSGLGEMLIFRIAVPAPATAGMIGLAGLGTLRRRRS